MILVQLNQENFEYDIHSLVKAFYPTENISVCVDHKENAEPVRLYLLVCYEPGNIRLELKEPDPPMSGSPQSLQRVFAVDDNDRKETKNLLKMNLYSRGGR